MVFMTWNILYSKLSKLARVNISSLATILEKNPLFWPKGERAHTGMETGLFQGELCSVTGGHIGPPFFRTGPGRRYSGSLRWQN